MLGTFGGGGAQRLAYNLACGLRGRVAHSCAIAMRDAGHYAEAGQDGVDVIALRAHRGGVLGGLRAALALRRLVSSVPLSVIHVHGTGSLPFVVAATRGLRGRVAITFTWQDSERVLDDKGWRHRRMVRSIRACASVSGSSRSVAERLSGRTGRGDVGVFHGGVPTVPMPARRWDTPPGVLWLGRVVPPKDPQALVRAGAALHAAGHDVRLCLVGKPIPSTTWYFDETRSLIDRLGVDSFVTLPGFVPDDAMRALFEQSHIGVQTSHTEGLSIALMEQMMAGLAIVATDVGDTACAIRHEENGLLIPPKDDAALVEALRRLVTDPALRRRLGDAARETAIREFSVDAMAERALQEYARVIGTLR